MLDPDDADVLEPVLSHIPWCDTQHGITLKCKYLCKIICVNITI